MSWTGEFLELPCVIYGCHLVVFSFTVLNYSGNAPISRASLHSLHFMRRSNMNGVLHSPDSPQKKTPLKKKTALFRHEKTNRPFDASIL